MSGHVDVVAGAAIAIVVVMVLTWVVSLLRHDASIVDIVWGLGFVVVAWVSRAIGDGDRGRIDLLTAMVTLWGLRLAVHLWWRNRGHGEDFRYQAMRRRAGANFAMTSLVTVFGLQGVMMMVVSLPVQLAATPAEPDLGWLAVLGVLLWGVGLFFETVGDAQLAAFKAEERSSGTGGGGRVMDRGLWRYTRHPNYFGDFCVWWGIFLVAAETPDARYGIVGPIVMSVLLMRVSGVPMLERSLSRRRPGYEDYVARTSAFFPRPPGAPDGR